MYFIFTVICFIICIPVIIWGFYKFFTETPEEYARRKAIESKKRRQNNGFKKAFLVTFLLRFFK